MNTKNDLSMQSLRSLPSPTEQTTKFIQSIVKRIPPYNTFFNAWGQFNQYAYNKSLAYRKELNRRLENTIDMGGE